MDFPVNKTTLYPDYRNNPQELEKILRTINVVREDRNTTITHIGIHGYASPEDTYEHNTYLAENRALMLKDYVCRLLELDEKLFKVEYTPEDWDGLRRYVKDSNLGHKQEILEWIDRDMDPDAKEWAIKSRYPDDYRMMLQAWYPALRHSDYVVTYMCAPSQWKRPRPCFIPSRSSFRWKRCSWLRRPTSLAARSSTKCSKLPCACSRRSDGQS